MVAVIPTAMEPFKFTKSRFILCEGEDDKGFLETIIEQRQLPDFQVCHAAECNAERTGGKSGFAAALRGFEAIRGFDSVRAFLIVTDNDKLGSSFCEVQQMLAKVGCIPPETVQGLGKITDKPLAILMVPSAYAEGGLETLCLPEINRKWPVANGCVSAFMKCTGADRWDKKSSVYKARSRSAIVGFNEDDPYKGIGHLFRNRTLSTLHTCFDGIAESLKNFDRILGI